MLHSGKLSYEVITVGIGSADVTTYHIELVEGLENGGYAVDESLQEEYLSYIKESRVKQPKRRFSFYAGNAYLR